MSPAPGNSIPNPNEIGCTVLIDGQPINDGCISTDDNVPTVLSGLRIQWGRSSTVDQPQPSTCVFHVDDPLYGERLVPSLTIGRQVDVRVDTIVYEVPGGGSVITGLYPANAVHAIRVSVAGDTMTALADGTGQRMEVTLPPLAFTSNPLGWDSVPRTLPGQAWRFTVTVTEPQPFAGYTGWAADVTPLSFTKPDGSDLTVLSPVTPAAPTADVSFVPPSGVWLGLRVRMWPTSPAWNELDTSTWNDLPGAPTLTNLMTNPTPASGANWNSNDNTKWTVTYAANEILVNRTATAAVNRAASMYRFGFTPGNPILDTATNYQRSVEVWVDAAGSVVTGSQGGFVGGQALPANTWTRVVEQFTGLGIAKYVMAMDVNIVGVGTGVHCKFRKAQLLVNPSGQTQPYFDGSTPDAGGIDYAWTGTANASTSTQTDTRAGVTWEDLGTFRVSGVQMLAPTSGAVSSALVFSGRITDVIAQWDGGAEADIQVIAQDWLAELANRYVGDVPWTAEYLGQRGQRIVQLSGQPVVLTVDQSIYWLVVTYRDVDRQPAATLLQQLATSGGGVLWTATHLVTGQVMRIEDVNARPAAFTLSDDGGLVHVITSEAALENALPVSSCEIDASPVRFILDMSDTISMVAVNWLEQTADTQNPSIIKPTQRTEEVVAPNTLAAIGARRMSVSTQLTSQADAVQQAEQWLARASVMAWRIEGLRWDSSDENLGPDEITTMMRLLDGTLRNGLPIALTDLPPWVGPMTQGQDTVGLYVEGGTYTYDAGSWVLELTTSAGTGSAIGTTPWNALDADWAWEDFDPEVSWLDLYGVTYPPPA